MPRKINKPIERCTFKQKPGEDNTFSVSFNEITGGEVLALIHALQERQSFSPVARDLASYFSHALRSANTDKTKDFLERLNSEG